MRTVKFQIKQCRKNEGEKGQREGAHKPHCDSKIWDRHGNQTCQSKKTMHRHRSQPGRQVDSQAGRQTDRQKERKTDRQKEERQTGRQAGRQTHKHNSEHSLRQTAKQDDSCALDSCKAVIGRSQFLKHRDERKWKRQPGVDHNQD